MSKSKIIIYLLSFYISSALLNPPRAVSSPDPCSLKLRTIIHDIRLFGLSLTRDYIVMRELKNRIGDKFSCESWTKERIKLEDLDIFAQVSLDIKKSDRGAILNYHFVELPGLLIFPALKKTDQLGWMLGAGFTFLNFLGMDIRFEGFARTSIYPDPFDASEFILGINSPYLFSLPVEYNLVLVKNNSYNPLKKYNENSINSLLDLCHKITGYFKIIYTGELLHVKHDFENDSFIPEGQSTGFPVFLSSGDSDYVPKLGTGLILDFRERIYNPHRGIYFELRYSKYGGALGGEADYEEYLFDFRGYLPLGRKHIFLLSGLGQYRPGMMGFYDFFHIGGSNSLRTYLPDSQLFGQHEFIGALEYRYEFFERRPLSIFGFNFHYGIQAVAGFDYDILWQENDTFSGGRSFRAYFLGLHILLPGIDRFRVEFGVHDVKLRDYKFEFGLTFGVFAKSSVQRERIR